MNRMGDLVPLLVTGWLHVQILCWVLEARHLTLNVNLCHVKCITEIFKVHLGNISLLGHLLLPCTPSLKCISR